MKTTLKVEEGTISITGKSITVEIDSDSTARVIEAKADLLHEHNNRRISKAMATYIKNGGEVEVSEGEDLLDKVSKTTARAKKPRNGPKPPLSTQAITAKVSTKKAAAKKVAAKKVVAKKSEAKK